MSDSDLGEMIEYGDSVGRSFLDKLLLAIIDAHPEQTSSPARDAQLRFERLRAARRALLAQAGPKGRPKNSDEAILRWMGEQLYRELACETMARSRGEPVPNVRSDRELADAARDCFKFAESRSESIRSRFGHQRQKWLDIARYHDDVPEQLDFNLLERIKSDLAKRGIKMDLTRIET